MPNSADKASESLPNEEANNRHGSLKKTEDQSHFPACFGIDAAHSYANGGSKVTQAKGEAYQEQARERNHKESTFLNIYRWYTTEIDHGQSLMHLVAHPVGLIDTKEENREVETRLVESYMKDPDFDRWYPLSAILSLVFTPPPNSLTELNIPTMFLVPVRGWSDPSYVKDLYNRLPPIKKKLVEVDGSVYWMLSHPKEASTIICEWFAETLSF